MVILYIILSIFILVVIAGEIEDYTSWAFHRNKVKVELIGVSDVNETKLICASFNAG